MSRPILDFFIYFAQHMMLAFMCFFLLWVLLDRRGGIRRRLTSISPVSRRRLLVISTLAIVVVFAGIGVWYLALDGFAGEVEPVVSSLSWLVQKGEPLYHDFTSAQRYSVLYGPSVFLTNGLFLKVLGPSLFSAKLASVLGVFGCLIFMYAALARSSGDGVGLFVSSLAVLYFWSQGFAVYLVRPDSLLLFAIGLSLYAAVRSRRLFALAAAAVMLGFAVNLKVHAAVYFLPVLTILIRRFGWRDAALCLAGSAFVIAAPFLLYPQVSAVNYVAWLRNAMDQGLGNGTLPDTLRFAAYLLLPLAVLLAISPGRRRHLSRNAHLLASLAPAYLITLVLAEKPGAGLVHMLPLVPTTLYAVGLVLRDVLESRHQVEASPSLLRQAAVAAVVLTVLLTGSVGAYRSVRLVDWQIDQSPNLAADVQGVMDQFPAFSIGMACGGENASFRHTWLRPLLVFANNPLLVEPVSVMDCALTGMEMPPETYKALENGVVALWLVPRNQRPFVKRNWYAPHGPLFSGRFIRHFESLYTLRGHSQYFDLWLWNGLEGGAADPTHYAIGGRELDGVLAP